MTERMRTFWGGFNIGHVLILIGMMGSVLAMLFQRERDLALLKFASDSQEIRMAALVVRLDMLERAGVRSEVMANDIAWIKAELQRKL